MRFQLQSMGLGILLSYALPAVAYQQIFLLRHAERGDQSPDPGLTLAGEMRAHRLAWMLQDAGITAIYVTEWARTNKTAEPLANKLSLKLIKIKADESKKLIEQIKADKSDGKALIINHSNTLPDLLLQLGAARQITFTEYDYDRLFVLTPRKDDYSVFTYLHF